MRRGEQNVLVIGQKVSAGGSTLAGRNHVLVAPVAIHDKNLIAFQLVPRGLKDNPLPVRRPIRLGVLASVGQLPDLAQVRGRLRR
jgi:hypothetical protein